MSAEIMIRKGFTELDIYGCDSWFDPNNYWESHTNQFLKEKKETEEGLGHSWNEEWKRMMALYPNIKFNFK